MAFKLPRFLGKFSSNILLRPKQHWRSITPYTLLHSSSALRCKSLEVSEKDVILRAKVFVTAQKKDRDSFLTIINSFQDTPKLKRGHVEFIYAALKCMEAFNVHKDIECYKKLMEIFPKGKMIARNLVQAEFFHFPRHQDCGLEVLDRMEENGVCPDRELKDIILNVFGTSSHVYKKYCRAMYWSLKFKNLNPYILPTPVPSDVEILAELALKKMSVDPRTKITHFKSEDLKDSIDHTWIVSAQSLTQQRLLKAHNKEKPVYVEGAFIEWMDGLPLSYFILRADPVTKPHVEFDDDIVSDLYLHMFGDPKPKTPVIVPNTIHEQEEGTIFGICITGTSSKDSMLSWIRFLQMSNPVLDNIPVLFTLRSPPTSLVTVNAPNVLLEGDTTEAKTPDEQKT